MSNFEIEMRLKVNIGAKGTLFNTKLGEKTSVYTRKLKD